MTSMTFTLTTEPNALHNADSTCDACDAPAPYFLDIHDDEYCASLCNAHALHHIAFILTNDEL